MSTQVDIDSGFRCFCGVVSARCNPAGQVAGALRPVRRHLLLPFRESLLTKPALDGVARIGGIGFILTPSDRVLLDLRQGTLDVGVTFVTRDRRLAYFRFALWTEVSNGRPHCGLEKASHIRCSEPSRIVFPQHRVGSDIPAAHHLQQFTWAKWSQFLLVVTALHEPLGHILIPCKSPKPRSDTETCQTRIGRRRLRSIQCADFGDVVPCAECRQSSQRLP